MNITGQNIMKNKIDNLDEANMIALENAWRDLESATNNLRKVMDSKKGGSKIQNKLRSYENSISILRGKFCGFIEENRVK
jgi:hypothetical protein